ncbi:MAG: hypothetical protein ACFFA0_16080 [Promethearchaeota archaeon]
MPEDKEKVEDFISLWRKKMMNEPDKPSVIGDTLNRIQEVEEENEQLRSKIQANIDLISKTEELIRNTVAENERLKEELKKSGSIGGRNVNDIQKENVDLSNKIKNLTINLTEKDNVLNLKDNEIVELKLKLNEAASAIQFMADTAPEESPETSKALIEDLQSELSKKKSHISELEQKITGLNNEINALNEQLINKETKLHVDYVLPVEPSKPEVIKPQPTQTSSSTLEILCQDLQADLNKYKKIVEQLNKDKSELEQSLEKGGFNLEPEEIKELRKENEELKMELSQVQENLREKSKATPETLSLVESTRLIEDLKNRLLQKDQIINDLKSSNQPKVVAPVGPMSSLVEDLQKTINKLKMTIEEKNKIIEELKPS